MAIDGKNTQGGLPYPKGVDGKGAGISSGLLRN